MLVADRSWILTISCPPYLIVAELAAGYWYKAFDPANNRAVSIRVVRIGKGTKSNAGLLMNVQIWRDRMAGVNHPHIARLYEVKYGVAEVYLVTEWVEGHSLRSMMGTHTAIAHPLVVYYMGQVGQALDHLHEKGIVHRDITLHRMVVDASGTTKLVDVGLAGLIPQINRIGGLEGAERGYSAPEELRSGSPSIEADLYRFSVACYELMVGTIPFSAITPGDLREQILRGEVSTIVQANKSTAKSLNKIFQSALSVNPANRPKAAGELLKALSRTGDRHSSHAVLGDSLITARDTIAHERPIRNRLKVVIAILLCISLIAGYQVIREEMTDLSDGSGKLDREVASIPQVTPSEIAEPAPVATEVIELAPTVIAKPPAKQTAAPAPVISKAVLAEVALRTGHERAILGGIRGLSGCEWRVDAMARQFIRGILRHDNPGVRREGLKLVAACKVAELVSETAFLLKDDDPSVRARALDALGSVGDDRFVTSLVLTSIGERNPLLNAKMLQVAGQLRLVKSLAPTTPQKKEK